MVCALLSKMEYLKAFLSSKELSKREPGKMFEKKVARYKSVVSDDRFLSFKSFSRFILWSVVFFLHCRFCSVAAQVFFQNYAAAVQKCFYGTRFEVCVSSRTFWYLVFVNSYEFEKAKNFFCAAP